MYVYIVCYVFKLLCFYNLKRMRYEAFYRFYKKMYVCDLLCCGIGHISASYVIQHYLADCILISLSCMLESERMFVYSCLLRDNLDAKSY